MRVERATKADIFDIVSMATCFEHETDHVKVDVAHSVKNYEMFIEQNIGGLLSLKTDGGVIVGGFGYIISEDLHYPRLLAIETFWIVQPEYRGSGLLLFAEFEKIARERNCHYTAMIHLSDSHPTALERIYHRKGYKLVEKHYMKEIQP